MHNKNILIVAQTQPSVDAACAGERRILRGAFLGALVIHLAFLAAFASTPSWQANGLDIEKINLFKSSAISYTQAVDVVSIDEFAVQVQAAPKTMPRSSSPLKQDTTKVVARKPIVKQTVTTTTNQIKQTPVRIDKQIKSTVKDTAPLLSDPVTDSTPQDSAQPAVSPLIGQHDGGPQLPSSTKQSPKPDISTGSGADTPQDALPGSGASSGNGDVPKKTDSGGKSGGERFVSRLADRSIPKVTYRGGLNYPSSAADEGVEGEVVLKVLVDEKGRVVETKIITSADDKRLDAAAEEWVKRWSYLPAVQDGIPRKVWTRAKVAFRLE